jgi:hypothetical protein
LLSSGTIARAIDGNPVSATTIDEKQMRYPVTPDGRYFVVRSRLWRCTDPALPEPERQQLTRELMRARAAVGAARRRSDVAAERRSREMVNAAKLALGERGPVWWSDGAPDYNRNLVKNTPYREWFERLTAEDRDGE